MCTPPTTPAPQPPTTATDTAASPTAAGGAEPALKPLKPTPHPDAWSLGARRAERYRGPIEG